MEGARVRRREWIGRLTLAAVVLLAERTATADLIDFRGGGVAQLPTAAEGDRIILRLPDGELRLHRDDIVRRVTGFWPPDEWESRRREARAAGTSSRHASVWWAIENGLTIEAIPEIRALHDLDPGHAPTARMVEVLDRLDRPCPDPDIAAFRAALGIEARIARGPHVLLIHQHGEPEAAERVAVLERVILGFHLLFAAQGVELRVPRRRLVSAWFAEREDYVAFLHRQGADAFASAGGYFHPTWGAVVAYDARSGEAQRAGRRGLAARREELRRSSLLLDSLPARTRVRLRLGEEPARLVGRADGRIWLDRLDREVSYRTALLDLDWRAIDLGLAAHEMVHQLAWDSGLTPRHDAFPYWLQEGFAAQFESIRGGRWAGIGRANDLRLPDWRAAASSARLGKLVRDVGFGRGYRRDLYAQAWALVYFLRSRHPSEFLAFLDLLRNPIPAPETPADGAGGPASEPRDDRADAAFRRAFGADLEALDRDWHRFMAGIRTPIEQRAPVADSSRSTRPDRAAPSRDRPPPGPAASPADWEPGR